MRSSRTPLDLPNVNLNYQRTTFYKKLDFSRFTNNRGPVGPIGVQSYAGVGIGMGGWGEEKNNKKA